MNIKSSLHSLIQHRWTRQSSEYQVGYEPSSQKIIKYDQEISQSENNEYQVKFTIPNPAPLKTTNPQNIK